MLSAIQNALGEARQAARRCGDARSKVQITSDFVFSRLLKYARLPGFNHTRTVAIDGLTIHYRFNRGDLQGIKEVIIDRAYELPLPFQPRTVLDLGANIGLASLWLARKYNAAKVIAVEPDEANAALTTRNLADNKIEAEVLCAAVGAVDGEGWFAPRAESNLGRVFFDVPMAGHKGQRVRVIGIENLVKRFSAGGLDLVKMDVEGAEETLLGGDVSWLRQVRALVAELHDDRVDSARMVQRVQQAGFRHALANAVRQTNLHLFVNQHA